MATPPKDTAPDVIGVPAAARLLGITPQAVRNHLRAGTLTGTKLTGKFGPEWHFRPGTLQAFAEAHYGRALDVDAAQATTPARGGRGARHDDPTIRELYERILTLKDELAQAKALTAHVEGERAADVKHLQDALAELRHERDAAQAQAAAVAAERDAARSDAERLRSRGWFARTFGGRG